MRHEEVPFERYLARVAAQLTALDDARRAELLAELRAHLADAAAAEGRDPADPAVQRLAIERLGPARRVGRELLAAHESPEARELRRTLGVGAAGALLIPWVVIGGLFINMERLAEITVLASQVALLLVAVALHRLTRAVAPRLSLAAALLGISGALTLPAMFLLSVFVRPPFDSTYVLIANLLLMGCLSLTGVWAILTGGMLLARHRLLALEHLRHDPLIGPALLAILWGAAWIVLASNLFVESRWAPFWLLNLAAPLWIGLHFLWCLWIGLALTQMARRGARAAPAAQW